ncbi:MAG: acetylesterase [Eubacterium sp.]|nr:acetylesterase [Eubacterium sp.]
MASGRMEFHAESIMQHANFAYVLPYDMPMEEVKEPKYYEREPKSLILLHGLTGTDTDWLFGGVAQIMAMQYNLAIFMPTTGNSFYLDKGYTGANYATYVGEELPDFIHKVFGFCESRENTLVGGLSMGGYGALHTAFTYPEKFSGCIGLSSAVVIKSAVERFRREGFLDDAPADQNPDPSEDPVGDVLPLPMLLDIFGDPKKLEGSDKDLEALFKKLKASGADIPKLYMAIGTDDSLLEANRDFVRFLKKEGADITYEEGPGIHDWIFWNEYIDRGLKNLLG